MIIEILFILAILLGGSATLRLAGMRGWILPVLGFLVGLSSYVIAGTLLTITPFVSSHPVTILSLSSLLPVGVWAYRLMRNYDVKVDIKKSIVVIIALVLAIVIIRGANMVRWTPDSYRYIMSADLIATDNFDMLSLSSKSKRMMTVPLVHTPASLSGERYMMSVTPLVSLSVLLTIFWISWKGLAGQVARRTLVAATVAGLLLLVTNGRFLFHSFYLNGHMIFAALLLISIGVNWLLARRRGLNERLAIIIQTIAIPALLLTRPEAFIIVGALLIPVVLSKSLSTKYKRSLLLAYGVTLLIWGGYLAYIYPSPPLSVVGLLVVGAASLAAIPLLSWGSLTKRRRLSLIAAEVAIWLLLIAASLNNIDILTTSVKATLENTVFGAGSWGLSLVILSTLTLAAVLLFRHKHEIYIRFSLTTFVPIMLLLAYLRDSPYRIGDGDSLNRMWIQIVPIAILYLIITAATAHARFKRLGKSSS